MGRRMFTQVQFFKFSFRIQTTQKCIETLFLVFLTLPGNTNKKHLEAWGMDVDKFFLALPLVP
jgi:hypothetical protein